MNKAEREYFDRVWGAYDIPRAVNLQDKCLANHIKLCYHEILQVVKIVRPDVCWKFVRWLFSLGSLDKIFSRNSQTLMLRRFDDIS